MTEPRSVSIDEVRALVAERQRYDDWLKALEERRAESPTRVFERVHGDYSERRRDVLARLREHVSGLSDLSKDLDASLASLDARLGALEDERAEAMLRTAVGEFDADQWEQVRQNVESQIAELGDQRTALLAEADEVRALLTNARSEPEEPAETEVIKAEAGERLPTVQDGAEFSAVGQGDASVGSHAPSGEPASDAIEAPSPRGSHRESQPHYGQREGERAPAEPIDEPLIDVLGMTEAVPTLEMTRSSAADDEEIGDAMEVFSHDVSVPSTATDPSSASRNAPSLDGLDVFDDAELGDLRMSPPARSTATATPAGSPGTAHGAAARENASDRSAASRDAFDDLAFLRSVVDPAGANGAARPSSSDQQKTLRCTECGTMNLPTEWYCERCGGELAAF